LGVYVCIASTHKYTFVANVFVMTKTAKPDHKKEEENDLVFSYLTLRNLIGILGMLLPVILLFAPFGRIQPSISDYYYTGKGDILVVVLSVLGVFLFTYYGYNRWERLLTIIAAVSGIGVAFVPTTYRGRPGEYTIHNPDSMIGKWFGEGMHFTCAGIFLVSLAIMSLVFFTKFKTPVCKDNGRRTQKGKRNMVYKICGWIMLGCVAVLALYLLARKLEIKAITDLVGDFPVIFVLESVAVEAFGFSWLTKGETFWPDGQSYALRILKMKQH